MIYSVSDVKNWKTCQAMGQRVIGMPRYGRSGPSRVGTAAHVVAQRYVQYLLGAKLQQDRAVAESIVQHERVQLPDEDLRNFDGFIWSFINGLDIGFLDGATDVQFEVTRYADANGKLISKEEAMQADVAFRMTPDVSWVDRDGRANILDWKSGRVVSMTEHPENNKQVLCYAWPLTARRLTSEVVLHVYHMRYSFPETAPMPVDAARDAWSNWLVAAVDLWRNNLQTIGNNLPVTLGHHCDDCPVQNTCEEHRIGRGLPEGMSRESLMQNFGYHDSKVSGLKKRIKSDVAQNGDFVHLQHQAYIVDKVRRRFKPEAFDVARVTFPDTDIAEAFQPSRDRLMKLLAKHGMESRYDELFGKYEVARVTTELRVRRARDKREEREFDVANDDT